ncbi:hypothetical protein RC54_04360 [Herbaspirillum rubrisubalbicans]|uniref:Uncharacterized protein n=1 Tax=Herbaspirillum rubrisubalbicans TaxID=80842 RepID=A0AAD0U613_9BURK|nr:hypothetical protein RC54_04360 [Herbaspirillum rubrisubalbicans]
MLKRSEEVEDWHEPCDGPAQRWQCAACVDASTDFGADEGTSKKRAVLRVPGVGQIWPAAWPP